MTKILGLTAVIIFCTVIQIFAAAGVEVTLLCPGVAVGKLTQPVTLPLATLVENAKQGAALYGTPDVALVTSMLGAEPVKDPVTGMVQPTPRPVPQTYLNVVVFLK
jgi:hypothetical protein